MLFIDRGPSHFYEMSAMVTVSVRGDVEIPSGQPQKVAAFCDIQLN